MLYTLKLTIGLCSWLEHMDFIICKNMMKRFSTLMQHCCCTKNNTKIPVVQKLRLVTFTSEKVLHIFRKPWINRVGQKASKNCIRKLLLTFLKRFLPQKITLKHIPAEQLAIYHLKCRMKQLKILRRRFLTPMLRISVI